MHTATITATRADVTIQGAVKAELAWTPDLDSSNVAVRVENSAVTLSGVVGSFSDFLVMGRAARNVRGVLSAVNNVTVNPVAPRWVTDSEISRIVERALTWSSTVPSTVTYRVLNGHVTLTGEVDWDFQREATQRTVEDLRDVEALDNQITLNRRSPAQTGLTASASPDLTQIKNLLHAQPN